MMIILILITNVAETDSGQETNFEIQLPTGLLHFSFQLLPLKYYLPNIIYQVQSITKHAWILN